MEKKTSAKCMEGGQASNKIKVNRRRACFVPGCRTGTFREVGISKFSAPRDEKLRKNWEKIINRPDKKLTEKCVVCEKHFEKSLIEKFYHYTIQGKRIARKRGRPWLRPGAIPTIFDNSDLPVENQENKQKKPLQKTELKTYSRISRQLILPRNNAIDDENEICEDLAKSQTLPENNEMYTENEIDIPVYRCKGPATEKVKHSTSSLQLCKTNKKVYKKHNGEENIEEQSRYIGETNWSLIDEDIFIKENNFFVSNVSLPSSYWRKIQFPNSRDTTVFAVWDSYYPTGNIVLPPPTKSVVVKQSTDGYDLVCNVFVAGINIQECRIPNQSELLEVLLQEIHTSDLQECDGAGLSEQLFDLAPDSTDDLLVQGNNFRSKDCQGFVLSGKVCLPCLEVKEKYFKIGPTISI